MSFTFCLSCEDRHPGCHGKCDKYISEKTRRDEAREKAMQAKEKVYDYESMMVGKNYRRMKRR